MRMVSIVLVFLLFVCVFPFQETILPTPLVTPESTPPQSPSPVKESFTLKTPESSVSINEMDEDVGDQKMMGEIGKNTYKL